jgi:hypothetical protein
MVAQGEAVADAPITTIVPFNNQKVLPSCAAACGLRKKDRQTSLGQRHSGSAKRPSWGPGMEASEGGIPYDTYDESNRGSNGIMLPGATAAGAPVEEKPKEKKRWIVRDRT